MNIRNLIGSRILTAILAACLVVLFVIGREVPTNVLTAQAQDVTFDLANPYGAQDPTSLESQIDAVRSAKPAAWTFWGDAGASAVPGTDTTIGKVAWIVTPLFQFAEGANTAEDDRGLVRLYVQGDAVACQALQDTTEARSLAARICAEIDDATYQVRVTTAGMDGDPLESFTD